MKNSLNIFLVGAVATLASGCMAVDGALTVAEFGCNRMMTDATEMDKIACYQGAMASRDAARSLHWYSTIQQASATFSAVKSKCRKSYDDDSQVTACLTGVNFYRDAIMRTSDDDGV